jgi:diketogulonate reductase-like aldo/keto reductase
MERFADGDRERDERCKPAAHPNAEPDYVVSAQGVRSPRILYGTAWKKQRTEEWVSQAIACGFRGIDTACQPKHYYEAGVGAAVAASVRSGLERSQLYLQTKFTSLGGQDPRQVPYDPDAPLTEQVAQSIEVSAQVLFRYLTGIGVVPLTGTTSQVHMRDDLAIFDFTLTDAERDSMGTLLVTP